MKDVPGGDVREYVHPPGHTQCDFGQAKAVVGGVEQIIHYFVLDLPHCDGCDVPDVAPTGYVRLMDGADGFPECRHRRRALFRQRVAARRNGDPDVRRLLASMGQTDGRKSAEADVAAASVDGDAMDPGLPPCPADVEVQTSAIRVSARVFVGLGPRRR